MTLSQKSLSDLLQLLLLSFPVSLVQLDLLLSITESLLESAAPEEEERSGESPTKAKEKAHKRHGGEPPVVFWVVPVVVVVFKEFFQSFGFFHLILKQEHFGVNLGGARI